MGQSVEIRVPNIGDFEDVEVVELLVVKGDVVAFDDPLVSVESEKATMEIPSTAAGVVAEILVSEGDLVSEGSALVMLDVALGATASDDVAPDPPGSEPPEPPPPEPDPEAHAEIVSEAPLPAATATSRREISPAASDPMPDRTGLPHASPLVRRYARELGVPIETAAGTGPHGRVLVDDLKRQVRERFADHRVATGTASGGSAIPDLPGRGSMNSTHETRNNEADITEMERFRRDRRALATERDLKLSPLVFVMKGVAVVLAEFPKLRASLTPAGDRLIVEEDYHLGIAVDTHPGIVVPVVRDVDRKGIFELASEVNDIAERARAGKLSPGDLSGGCFAISSLGEIGVREFWSAANAPEVAILGLSQTRVQPVWSGSSPLDWTPGADDAPGEEGHFEPRLMLPLSLSYDPRVIEGSDAVRFTTRLAKVLSDPMHLLL